MRVLIAHNRYRAAGGEERHVDLLETGLRETGVEVRRFERDSAELDKSRLRRLTAGITLTYRPGGGGIGRALADWQPQVVHFHNLWPLLTPSALRIAKQHGAAVVVTIHNYRFACPGGTLVRGGLVHDDCVEGSSLACALRNPRGARMESLAYGFALEIQRRFGLLRRWVDALVAPSEFMGRMLVRAGLPEERLHVIPYGLGRVEPSAEPARFALFIGRLSEEKGVRTLLEAARIASGVPVAVAGAGPLATEVAAGGVLYLGSLDQPEVATAIGKAAFVIVPSECDDNLPFAALEAIAGGKPVIATNLGGLPEIVKDGVTGLLVPSRAPSALAEAMQFLWDQPQRRKELGTNALRLARETFSLERQIERTRALYEALTIARTEEVRAPARVARAGPA